MVKRLVRIERDEVECSWASDINASIRKHLGRQAPGAEMWGIRFRKRSRMENPTTVCGENVGHLHLTRRIWIRVWYMPLSSSNPPRTCEKDLLDGLDYRSPRNCRHW